MQSFGMKAGVIQSTSGTVATVAGGGLAVGELCRIHTQRQAYRHGEVIALTSQGALVWVEGGCAGLGRSAYVLPDTEQALFPVGPQLLGRVLDPYGRPLDGQGPLEAQQRLNLLGVPPQPMGRAKIDTPWVTGVRSIDGLCTLGVGQRVAVMAPAGTGKTTLMGMIAKQAQGDVNVVALVGERGRELRAFVEDSLGVEGLKKSVVICATSDRSPIERQRAAFAATSVAEWFRDQGQQVVLMVDSLTRFARAQRELGLAQGEMPTRRGFPPSLFAVLPQLLERAGPASQGAGSITALYTVLQEDADTADPVAEEVISLLDGHLQLSREVAARGIYPALDVAHSLSRLMPDLVSSSALQAQKAVRRHLAKHKDILPLVQMGEYEYGRDAEADQAMQCVPNIEHWMTQDINEHCTLEQTQDWLLQVLQ